jgi:hypothetical protein
MPWHELFRVFAAAYNKRATKWLKCHPELRQQYLQALQLLEKSVQLFSALAFVKRSIARRSCGADGVAGFDIN